MINTLTVPILMRNDTNLLSYTYFTAKGLNLIVISLEFALNNAVMSVQ
mgnify:CR=1